MKYLVTILLLTVGSVSSAALLAPPLDLKNTRAQLEVLPPMGFLGCEECQKQFMGGVKGPSSAQLTNIRYHMAEIYGDSGAKRGGRAGSIKDN